MDNKELRKRHSAYCRYSNICDKEHDCSRGDFCTAYELRFQVNNAPDMPIDSMSDEFMRRIEELNPRTGD